MQSKEIHDTVEQARSRWLDASERASQLAANLFQPGTGYGDPDARAADEHRPQSAKHDAEFLFREYHDLDRREMELKLLDLQRSQDWPLGLRLPWQQLLIWQPSSVP